LENYHLSEAFKLISLNSNCNIFSDLSIGDKKLIRKRIINMVLATDMIMHNEEQKLLDKKLGIIESTPNLDPKKSMLANYIDKINLEELINLQGEFLNTLIHSADISNPTKPLNLYNKWTTLVINEFWKQGDIEKEMNLTVSRYCDRNIDSVPQIQIGFIKGVVFPMFNTIVKFFPNLEFTKTNLNKNMIYNENLKEKEDREKEKFRK
jgi:cAMP-specific phosphodiesterase 4